MSNLSEILTGVEDKRLLYRERAIMRLDKLLKADEGINKYLSEALKSLLQILEKKEALESKHGALMALKMLIQYVKNDHETHEVILHQCKTHFVHSEHRVRAGVADVLGALSSINTDLVFQEMKLVILDTIKVNLERTPETKDHYCTTDDPEITPAFNEGGPYSESMPGGGQRFVAEKKTDLMHDTEGWKSLETSIMALQRILEGGGKAAAKYVDQPMLDILFVAYDHTNRFVREIGYRALGSICEASDHATLDALGSKIVPKIASGLADNWSQVRFAASVSARQFIESRGQEHLRQYDAILLPPMCLNRYYVAEGVRLYSHATWKIAVGNKGPEYLNQNIESAVEFYVSQSHAPNHAVREAACAVIAEMARKLDKEQIRPFIPQLLAALLDMFKDGSWPVRDSASIASGHFVETFPEESRTSLPELYSLWFAHLSDNISSVRDDTAVALGHVMKAYGEEAKIKVIEVLRDQLPSARNQPMESERHKSLSNTTTFGVAERQIRDNDPDLHTNQVMYSCGSMNAKSGPKEDIKARAGSTEMLKRGGGCMDHGFSRETEPCQQVKTVLHFPSLYHHITLHPLMETTDGCICLVRELASKYPKDALEFVPLIAEMSSLHPFAHYNALLETIWKNMPVLIKSVGLADFEQHLALFISPLSTALRSESRLVQDVAQKALKKMKNYFGAEALLPL